MAPLALFLGRMTRIILRSRRLLAVSILILLAGVVVLSAATREPCLQVSTAPWHLWKAGHITKSEGQEINKQRVTAQAQAPQVARPELPAAPPRIYLPQVETIPITLSLVDQIRNFKAPPTRS